MAETKENSLSKAFVGFVLERASAAPKIKDTGFVARMKRADNPDLEYQVWNILLKFNVDIEFAARRLPFCLIGAALCRRQPEKDGIFGLGASLRSCFGDDEDQGSIRLRRLLANDRRGMPYFAPDAFPHHGKGYKTSLFCYIAGRTPVF